MNREQLRQRIEEAGADHDRAMVREEKRHAEAVLDLWGVYYDELGSLLVLVETEEDRAWLSEQLIERGMSRELIAIAEARIQREEAHAKAQPSPD